MAGVKRQKTPFDPLTSIADTMLDVLEDHSGVKAIVMLTEGEDNGIAISGWQDDIEAVTYMLIHLQAMMRANGKELRVMTEDGVFIDGIEDDA